MFWLTYEARMASTVSMYIYLSNETLMPDRGKHID
jgi:hypothetical protein